MNLAIGPFRLRSRQFASYDDMEQFVRAGGGAGEILGIDAPALISFWGLEAVEPFGNRNCRYGIIMGKENGGPDVIPILYSDSLLLGFNSQLALIELDSSRIRQFALDGWFAAFLQYGQFVAAIHELGALVLRLPACEKVGDLTTGVVSDATFADNRLVLTSDDDVTSELDLTHEVQSN